MSSFISLIKTYSIKFSEVSPSIGTETLTSIIFQGSHSESQTQLSEKKRHKKNLCGFDLLKGDVKNFEFF